MLWNSVLNWELGKFRDGMSNVARWCQPSSANTDAQLGMTGVGVVYPTTQLVNAKSRYLTGLKTNSLVPRPESRRFGSDLKPQIAGFYFDLDVKILVLAGKEDKILVLVPVSKVRCCLTSLRSASAVLTVVPCLSFCLSVCHPARQRHHRTTQRLHHSADHQRRHSLATIRRRNRGLWPDCLLSILCTSWSAPKIEIYINTILYGTSCYFNVRSKADISRLNLPHGNDN